MNPSEHRPEEGMLSPSGDQNAEEREKLAQQLASLKEVLIRIAPSAVSGELTSTVAHEINNPIFGILNFLELAMEDLDQNHPIQQYLSEAMTQTERISRLISELQCINRAESSAPEPFDPLNAVHSALALYQKRFLKSGIEVKQHHINHAPQVFGVKGKLMEAIIDLCSNARRSMESIEKGKVEIRTSITDAGWFRFEVEDYGIGLPQPDIQQLFSPFVSFWHPPGAGLGLVRVKESVERMKGHIALEPCMGHSGVTAYIELPPAVTN